MKKEIEAIFYKETGYTFYRYLEEAFGVADIENQGIHVFDALRRYTLGDKSLKEGYSSIGSALRAALKENGLNIDNIITYPVYAYIHGNMALSLTPFGDKWDSGLAGYIVLEKQFLREYLGRKKITEKSLKVVTATIREAITMFNEEYALIGAKLLKKRPVKENPSEYIVNESDSNYSIFTKEPDNKEESLKLLKELNLISKEEVKAIQEEKVKFEWHVVYN